MERAAITMPFLTTRPEKLGFGLLGLLQGQFRGDRDVSVQFGIELLDAGEHQLGELPGREFAFAEEFSDFLDGCEGQVGVVHRSHIRSQSNMSEIQARHRKAWRLEVSFLMAEIPERANVGDDEGETKLILRAHLSEVDAAIFDSEAAAAAVVTELHDLVLQCLVLKVIAETVNEIKPLAGFASVADQPANLVGIRLLEGSGLERKVAERRIGIQAEVGNSGK